MALRWDDTQRTLDVGVHDLLDAEAVHVHRLAMSNRARLAAGVEVHRTVQASYHPSTLPEQVLRHVEMVRGWTCRIHGRVDGLSEEGSGTVIEEIKSTAYDSGVLQTIPSFPAWEAQLQLYLYLIGRPALGRLRVVSLVDGGWRFWTVYPGTDTGTRVRARLDEWVLSRERWLAWQARRRSTPVPFAHDALRSGQEELIQATEATIQEGRHLLVTAPTGCGKTAAVLYGALPIAATLGKRIFYATARTTQQWMVEATLRTMMKKGGAIRSVVLRARDKACLNGVVDCRPEACTYADRYYEKLRGADLVERVLGAGVTSPEQLSETGQLHKVCPFELAMDSATHADVIIGDYNHLFDPWTRPRCLPDDDELIVILDEAHQLPDRVMSHGSPSITHTLMRATRQQVEDEPAMIEVLDLLTALLDDLFPPELRNRLPPGQADDQVIELSPRKWAELRDSFDALALDHLRLRLRLGPGPDPWFELAQTVFRFAGALERAGEETVAITSSAGVRLLCRDPAPFLGPRINAFHATIALSATLRPLSFFQQRLGMESRRVSALTIDSPFPPENRQVLVVPGVSTAFKHRSRDRDKVAEIIERTAAVVPGNVAVFFSSFQQRDELLYSLDLPGRVRLIQTPAMDEPSRAEMIHQLREGGPPKALLGVLGGIFSEGVDLPGRALSAVLIVGPALPVPGLDRDLISQWCADRYGDGFGLAYVQPGMTRVVQAAGRVVRGPDERGVVVLICQRFLQHEFADYLPQDWDVQKSRKPWEDVERFFAG